MYGALIQTDDGHELITSKGAICVWRTADSIAINGDTTWIPFLITPGLVGEFRPMDVKDSGAGFVVSRLTKPAPTVTELI